MLSKILIQSFVNKLTNREKLREIKRKKKLKKKRNKECMMRMFGKVRYYLSIWFGEWVLFACNNNTCEPTEKPYQKFYSDERVANRYAKKLREKYEHVDIDKVFDKKRKGMGYILIGKGKKVAEPAQQPSNIISLAKYKVVKAK